MSWQPSGIIKSAGMRVQEGDVLPRILLVDDNPALVRMLRLALISDGFDVASAEDGEQALKRLDDDRFDLIILDLQMPRMDGRTFYRVYRQRGGQSPVIILSAYGAASAQQELNAEAAIAKPFDPEVLLDTVKALLKQPAA